MTTATPGLGEAIDGLYDAFLRYPLRPVIEGCPHCVGLDDQADLHLTPLRELTDQALGRYAFKAITTWGDAADFRHFLPRLLELALTDGPDSIDLEVVLGKLELAGWRRWPDAEQHAVTAFLAALWRTRASGGPARYSLPDLADMLGEAGFDLAPFLTMLGDGQGEHAARQVAALCRHAASKPARGQPARGQPARGQPARGQPARGQPARGQVDYLRQVRGWLARPATRAQLEAGFFAAGSAEVATELSEALLLAEAIAAGASPNTVYLKG